MKCALLNRARSELLSLGYVCIETRADLHMVGVDSATLEAYLSNITGV